MKLQEVLERYIDTRISVPTVRIARESAIPDHYQYPKRFIEISFTSSIIMEEDDNLEGGGRRYWEASAEDILADDWEYFDEPSWWEK
jgi:hypothetical protein